MKTQANKFSETDIAKPVIEWLKDQHFEIYQEVEFFSGGGTADIVAVRNEIMWIVECKRSMTFTVLEQADRWHSHYRSIAIPAAMNRDERRFAYSVARDHGIGIIEIKYNKFLGQFYIEEYCKPKLHRLNNEFCKKMMFPRLREEHKTFSMAGTNTGLKFTPYQGTIIKVREFIQDHPGCTTREIYTFLGKCHYHSENSFMGSISSALQTFEKSWCEARYEDKALRFFIRQASNE